MAGLLALELNLNPLAYIQRGGVGGGIITGKIFASEIWELLFGGKVHYRNERYFKRTPSVNALVSARLLERYSGTSCKRTPTETEKVCA